METRQVTEEEMREQLKDLSEGEIFKDMLMDELIYGQSMVELKKSGSKFVYKRFTNKECLEMLKNMVYGKD
jgi:hypothetical protein